MALDPSIALGYRPPQVNVDVPSPIQQFGQILSLRNMMTQGQTGQLEFQTKMLQLQQLQRTMQEQEDYARAMKAYADAGGSTTAPAGAAPVQTAPVVPSVQPTPPGGTAAQIAPATIAPLTPAAGASPASVSGWMTPQVSAPQAQAPAAPAATSSVMANPGLSRLGGMNAAQFIARFPLTGLSRIKEAFALDQAEAEAAIKQHDAAMGKADEVGRAARAVRDSKDPATQFVTELTGLGNKGLLPWSTVQQMVADGYDKHKNDIDAFIVHAQNGKDYAATLKDDIATAVDKRKLAQGDYAQVNGQPGHEQFLARYPELRPVLGDTFSQGVKDAFLGPAYSEAQAKATEAAAKAKTATYGSVAQDAGLPTNQAEWDTFRAGVPDPLRSKLPATYSKAAQQQTVSILGQTPNERVTSAETAKQHGLQNVFEAVRTKIAQQRNAREENIYQQTYGEGANPYLVGVDPKMRTKVTGEAQKIGDEYVKAQAAADQFQSLLELAKKGNKAGFSNLPLVGVETLNAINGIKRINKGEIDQYGGAGSLYDKIVGKIGGLTQGQTIPADVLQDIETMHNILRQNSESEFRARRRNLNDNYKSNFPTDPPSGRGGARTLTPDVQKALSGAERGKMHKLSDGSWWIVKADGSIEPATAPVQ